MGCHLAGDVAALILVAILWGTTNPFLKRGTVGLEQVKKESRLQQMLAEIKFLCLNYKVLAILHSTLHTASNFSYFKISGFQFPEFPNQLKSTRLKVATFGKPSSIVQNIASWNSKQSYAKCPTVLRSGHFRVLVSQHPYHYLKLHCNRNLNYLCLEPTTWHLYT